MQQVISIKHNIHAAYRPQNSGSLKKAHRTLKNSLWILCEDLKLDWEEALPYARRAFNMAINSATKMSLHLLVFGREPNITGLDIHSTNEKVSDTCRQFFGPTFQATLQSRKNFGWRLVGIESSVQTATY